MCYKILGTYTKREQCPACNISCLNQKLVLSSQPYHTLLLIIVYENLLYQQIKSEVQISTTTALLVIINNLQLFVFDIQYLNPDPVSPNLCTCACSPTFELNKSANLPVFIFKMI